MKRTLSLALIAVLIGVVIGFAFGRYKWKVHADDASIADASAGIDSAGENRASEMRAGGKRDEKPPIVGTWVYSLSQSGDITTDVSIVTITNEGVYHWLKYETIPDKENPGSEGGWLPDGAEVAYSTGEIDLATGKERIDPSRLSVSFRGVTWAVEEGRLHWRQDLGSMGGQGLQFWRVDD